MKRRFFLKFLGVSAPLTGFNLFLPFNEGCFAQEKHLKLTETQVALISGQKIILPHNPPADHCISFSFLEKTPIDSPQIRSRHQTIVHTREPLVVNQRSIFKMAFDGRSQDWYVVREA